MISRRTFFSMAAGAVAGITGWESGKRSKVASTAPEPMRVRIHTREIDDHGNFVPSGKLLTWITADVTFVAGSVGNTILLERTYEDGKVEEWRAMVTRIYCIHTGEDLG